MEVWSRLIKVRVFRSPDAIRLRAVARHAANIAPRKSQIRSPAASSQTPDPKKSRSRETASADARLVPLAAAQAPLWPSELQSELHDRISPALTGSRRVRHNLLLLPVRQLGLRAGEKAGRP